jgi:NAD(P)-dependent dehydrogenase (short-subunit alcohol dehydrogenase family)
MSIFKGKKVLIVGGSSGVGFDTACMFDESGADVTIASRNQTKLNTAIDKLSNRASSWQLDITDIRAIEACAQSGTLWDHIVISAADTPMGNIRDLPFDKATQAMDSKFWGAYRIARLIPIRPGGSLTFVAGYLSQRPGKSSALQSAINAALEGLGRALALEMAPTRVNTVSPGLINTELWSSLEPDKRETLFDSVSARLPVRRIGSPRDIAEGIIFLASNGYATGTTLYLDGGGCIA